MMDFYDVFGRWGAAHLSVLLLLTCMFCLPKPLVVPLDYLDYLMDWLLLLTFPVYFLEWSIFSAIFFSLAFLPLYI